MRLLLLHLCDTHFEAGNKAVLERIGPMVDSVQNIGYGLDACMVVLAGDVAWSGRTDEYEVEKAFLSALVSRLGASLRPVEGQSEVPVHVVAVPGNHDCCLEEPDAIRDDHVRQVLANPTKVQDESVVSSCLSPQSHFFDFLTNVQTAPRSTLGTAVHASLCYQYSFAVEDEELLVTCCNTAWISERRESQGALYFPPEAIPENADAAALSIVVMHHPYGWLDARSRRRVQETIDRTADYVLSGHEHQEARGTWTTPMGSSTQYVEGGVFSKPHSDECEGFNAFVLDTRNRQQKFVNLVWDGRQYRAGEDTERGDEGSGLGWTPLNLNNARRNSEFTLSDQMTAYLDDTGTNLSHPEKGRLTLRDVYVYPRVIEVVQRQRDATNELDSARLLDECDRDRTVLITGDHAVGKTSLAKMLYQAALEREWVPVMLLGRGRLPVDDRLFGHVERQFVEQYGAEQRDAYSRLDRARKVIIVDDYDRFDLRPSELLQLVRQLVLFADRVLLLADDLVLELQDLVSPGLGTDIDIQVSHYRLQPLDRVGRDKLIRRWLHLADQGKNAQHAFLDALERAATIVDSVIGRNVVPSYPIVVLSLLQASQYSVPINTHASTNAYFYNLLIMNQLAAERSQPEFGVMMSYLTLLAYAMFHHGGRISEEGLIGFHQWFETTFRISRPFERFRQELVDQRILQRVDDEYHFRYSYFYYHFLANYMNDNLGKHGIRDEVRRLCERLDNETNANILLFLVHLSRDRFVIDTLMKTVRKQFQGIAPFQLEGGIALTGHADFASLTARFDSENARATRESMLAKMDEGEKLARRHEQQQANDLGTLDEVTNVLRAIRALGILGQVVKNYAGVVPGSIMKEMAVECYELGLRTLTVMVDLVRVREDLIIEAMVHKLRAESGAFTLAEAANMATQNLAALVHMVGSGLIKRTSLAVGSDELGQVYREIVAEHPTLSYQAIDLSIRLDVDDRLPHRHVKQMMDDIERNEFAKSIVRYLVMRRLSLRPGRRDAMQKLCDSVGIEYRRVQRSLARPRDRPWKDGA